MMEDQDFNFKKEMKVRLGIVISKYKNKKCDNCFFYNKNKLCGKHSLKTLKEEVCPEYTKFNPKIYAGGRVSPR